MEMVAMTKKAARSRSSLKYSGAPARERVGYTLCTFRERFARALTLAKLAEIVDLSPAQRRLRSEQYMVVTLSSFITPVAHSPVPRPA